MGVGTLDDTQGHMPEDVDAKQPGLLLTLREGDVIVHPAGTSHSNVSVEGHYRYLALFPRVRVHTTHSVLSFFFLCCGRAGQDTVLQADSGHC